jgi:hypothetical protein
MAKVNDYSGFNQVFRDTVIGVVLSTGVLSTLLPNILETISETRELDTFKALNFFSVIYFVGPVMICTTYWLLSGFRNYSLSKLTLYEQEDACVKANSPEVAISITLLCILKLAPILLFLFNQSWAGEVNPVLYGLYYATLATLELRFATLLTKQIADKIIALGNKTDYPSLLKARAFRINILLFTLDMFIGLALAVFNKPWVFYMPQFYIFCTVAVTVYSVVALSLHWRINKPSNLPIDVIITSLLVVTIGCCVPAINLHWKNSIPWVNYTLLIAIIILLVRKLKTLTDYFRVLFPACLFILTFIFITQGYENTNRSYFLNRREAALQMPVDKLFPFYFFESFKGSYKESVHKALAVDSFNHRSLKTSEKFRKADFLNKLLKNYNTRKIYYYAYDSIIEKHKHKRFNSISQDSINLFYYNLTKHLAEVTFSKYLDGCCKGNQMINDEYELKEYGHPLDFYAKYLKDEKMQLVKIREMISTLARIRNLRIVMLNKNYRKNSISLENSELAVAHDTLVKRLSHTKNFIQDIRYEALNVDSASSLQNRMEGKIRDEIIKIKRNRTQADTAAAAGVFQKGDSVQLRKLSQFLDRINSLTENRYAEVYRGGQKIYRSYLADSQRIGVYTFITALIILLLAWYYCKKDDQEFSGDTNENADFSLQPSQLFFIQALSVFILLVPLMRPIRPENIDPEKPYWMMTLQNWYAPSFTAKIGSSEKFTPEKEKSGELNFKNIEDKLDSTNTLLYDVNLRLEKQSTYDGPKTSKYK